MGVRNKETINMDGERGKLVYYGVMGRDDDTVKGLIKYGVILLIVIIIFAIILILSIKGDGTILGSSFLSSVLSFFFLVFSIYGLISYGGFEIDGIYEYGLTHRYYSLIDRFKGKTFVRYEKITKIEYGITKSIKGQTQYIRYFTKETENTNVPYFCENIYKNEFYKQLFDTLKIKCPNAVWKRVDKR